MSAQQSTAILVVGMHRSGTSALAGLLAKMGVPLGAHLLAPGEDNPKGYWEHQDVVTLHERLFAELGSRWDDVRPLPDGWQVGEPARRARTAISDIISRDFSGEKLWAVKDPRLCRVLPLWLQALDEQNIRPVILFIVRHPGEVAASIEVRNHWHPLVGKLLWLRYMTEALKMSTALAREVVLYDDLLDAPIFSVETALVKVGVDIGVGISATGRATAAQFVEVSARHHLKPTFGPATSKVDVIAGQVYESLAGIAHGVNCWDAVDKLIASFDREWRKNGALVDAVASMAFRIEATRQAEKVDSMRLRSDLTAQVLWSEQAKQKIEMLHAEKASLNSNLNAQLGWSEEARLKIDTLQAERDELNSALNAQLRWSEEAQLKIDALQTQRDDSNSKLGAQIRWSEEAQLKIDVLQSLRDDLNSKLSAQIRWSEEAQLKIDVLQTQRDDSNSKLGAQIRRSEEAQLKIDVLQSLRDDLNSKLSAQIRWSDQAQRKFETLQVEHSNLESQMVELEAMQSDVIEERDRASAALEVARDQRRMLEAELRQVYASRAWKLTAPIRSAHRLLKRKTVLVSPRPRKPE